MTTYVSAKPRWLLWDCPGCGRQSMVELEIIAQRVGILAFGYCPLCDKTFSEWRAELPAEGYVNSMEDVAGVIAARARINQSIARFVRG